MRAFHDKLEWVETELRRMDMAAALDLLAGDCAGRAKMFRAKMQIYDNLDELGNFVGKSDHDTAR